MCCSGKLAAGGESGKVVSSLPDPQPKMSVGGGGAGGLERGRIGSFGRGMG